MEADELERLAAMGLISAGQADSARRVDDAIALTALGKLVCIGTDAKALLPGYAQAFGLIPASDAALARQASPKLPDGVIDALAALPAAPTHGDDGTMEIVVASAEGAARLVELPLPPHRVLVADEPRVMALLDRVLGAGGPGAPLVLDDAPVKIAPPREVPPTEETSPTAKAQRWLARPVREIDRREKREPSGPVVIPPPVAAASGPTPVVRREAPLPVPKPQARGLSIGARAVIALTLVLLGAAGIVVVRMKREPPVVVVVDARGPALTEGRVKEREGELAWAVAAYSKVVADPRRDDDTAEALLGRARSNIGLGDRVSALADIALVVDGSFASAPMKAKAEELRATLR